MTRFEIETIKLIQGNRKGFSDCGQLRKCKLITPLPVNFEVEATREKRAPANQMWYRPAPDFTGFQR